MGGNSHLFVFMAKIKAREKGARFECSLADFFRSLGYSECVTSRSESKRLDDLGVDLCYTDPWQVQAKAVENLGSGHTTLQKMPKTKGKINLLFHKKNYQGTIVSMTQQDFTKILTLLIDNGIIKPK